MIKKIFVVATLFLFIFLPLCFFISKIKIKNIKCISQYGTCSIDIQKSLGQIVNKNILESRKEILNSLKQNSFIEVFKVKYYPLQTYEVYIIEKKKSVAFYYNNEYLFLDQKNKVLTKSPDSTLPAIQVTTPGISYSELSFAGEIYTSVAAKYFVDDASVSNEGLQLKIGDKQVIFPLEGDPDIVLGSLELTLSWLKQGTNFSKIDLRYKNPVLK